MPVIVRALDMINDNIYQRYIGILEASGGVMVSKLD